MCNRTLLTWGVSEANVPAGLGGPSTCAAGNHAMPAAEELGDMSLPRSAATRIALLYLAIALPWVLGTDVLVRMIAPSPGIEAQLNSFKGAGFVIVTTLVLYAGLRRWTDSLTRARHTAEESEARLASFVATMDDVVFVTDADQRFVEVMGPATTGRDRARFLGKRAPEIFGDEVGRTFIELGDRAMAGELVELDWSADTMPPLFPVDSAVTSLHLTLTATRAADGSVTGLVGVGRDTSPLREVEAARDKAERRITYLTDNDPLTGLASRMIMEQRLSEAIARAREEGRAVALHLVNLDHFRDVNDSLGYDAGDALLRAVARRLAQYEQADDTLSRLSADDFVLAQVGIASHDEARIRAEVLVRSFDQPFAVQGHELRCSASVGVALFPDNALTPSDLLRAADAAMYAAKSRRRTEWVCYEPEMNAEVSQRLQLANELRVAVEQDEIDVAYQPIVRAGDARPISFEALARWQSPTLGTISPAVFIPVAERVGLIDDLGRCVRLKAYAWLARAHAEGYADLQVEVNVSPRHFLRGNVARLVEEAEVAGIDPKFVVLEITESGLVDVGGSDVDLMHELTRHGFQIAVDDFGTGYSSLAYLGRLPISVVKVAQEFIGGSVSGPEATANRVVVETTIQMSRRLGYQTVAEGVEDAEVARYLESVGIDAHQGYHFGRPVPADEAIAYLRTYGTLARSS